MVTFAVIVSYNDAKNTLACVNSLRGQARIVVWDNGSSDATMDLLNGIEDITIHANPTNVMWTPALNGAIETYYDGEDYILISNNDIVYRPDTIERLSAGFLEPTAGLVGPSGSRLGGLQDFVTNHPNPGIVGHRAWVESRPTVRTNYLVGASVLIRRECYQAVGAFDNDMPLGADDHDYCIRAKAEGWTIWVVNSAYVEHQGHASFPHAKKTWDEWGEKSWAVFNEKWDGYYFDENEAIKCHWNPVYTPGWDFGTGRLSQKKRAKVYERRD